MRQLGAVDILTDIVTLSTPPSAIRRPDGRWDDAETVPRDGAPADGTGGAALLDEVVLEPAAAAFLEVGTFVALALAGFGLLRWRLGDRLPAWLEAHRHLGPIAGALLGAFPGCGGAIVVIPLYLKGQVSFGTVVATLTATMGDSSFVLLAADPLLAVAVHAGLVVVGAATGAGVDRLGITPRRSPTAGGPVAAVTGATSPVGGPDVAGVAPAATITVTPPAEHIDRGGSDAAVPDPGGSERGGSEPGGSEPGRSAAAGAPQAGERRDGPGRRGTPWGLLGFWSITLAGLVVAVPTVLQLVEPSRLDVWGLPTTTVLGLTGALMAVGVTLAQRRRSHAEHAHQPAGERPRTVLTDAAAETARVTTWVVVAFVGYELAVVTTGLDVGTLPTIGLLGVVAGALLGLVPGCGPQLVLTGLYAQGALPLSVLAANALSQDGDALIPLLASDRRAAVLASVITVVPGLLVGAAMVALGF